jgi:hypothetical protein
LGVYFCANAQPVLPRRLPIEYLVFKAASYGEDAHKFYLQRTRCFDLTRFVRFAHTAQRCRKNTADEYGIQALTESKI